MHVTTLLPSLAEAHPEVAARWHPTLNGPLRPDQVAPYEQAKVWWTCPAGHAFERGVVSSVRAAGECRVCRFCLVSRPEILAEWNAARNGAVDPSLLNLRDSEARWWTCARGHDFQASVVNRVHGGRGCSGCASLLAVHRPHVMAEWHPDRNPGVDPSALTLTDGGRYWWRCAAGHEWQDTVDGRVKWAGNCVTCAVPVSPGPPPVGRSLADLFPEVAEQWHPTRNQGAAPEEFNTWLRTVAWWQCAAGHEWASPITSRTQGWGACSICQPPRRWRATVAGCPGVLAFWDAKRNEGVDPAAVTVQDDRPRAWVCDRGHEWSASFESVYRSQRCPACYRIEVLGERSIAVGYPHLLAEWHPTRNGSADPALISATGDFVAWWVCVRGHAYQKLVKTKIKGGGGCGECTPRVPDPGIEDVCARYARGESLAVIAAATGVPTSRIGALLDRAGVRMRPAGFQSVQAGQVLRKPADLSSAERRDVCRQYRAGMSITDISARLNMSYSGIRRLLIDEGVPMRPRRRPTREERLARARGQ